MKRLKRFIKEIAISLVILFVVSNIFSYLRRPVMDTNHLPFINVKSMDGKQINFKDYEGKPLFVHIWATWCPTCRLESSNIENISKKYSVVTIVVKSGNNEKVKKYMSENNFTFDVINDNSGEYSAKFNVEAFPTTFIYNSKGELKFTEVGYTTTVGLLARVAMLE